MVTGKQPEEGYEHTITITNGPESHHKRETVDSYKNKVPENKTSPRQVEQVVHERAFKRRLAPIRERNNNINATKTSTTTRQNNRKTTQMLRGTRLVPTKVRTKNNQNRQPFSRLVKVTASSTSHLTKANRNPWDNNCCDASMSLSIYFTHPTLFKRAQRFIFVSEHRETQRLLKSTIERSSLPSLMRAQRETGRERLRQHTPNETRPA